MKNSCRFDENEIISKICYEINLCSSWSSGWNDMSSAMRVAAASSGYKYKYLDKSFTREFVVTQFAHRRAYSMGIFDSCSSSHIEQLLLVAVYSSY